MGGSSPGRLPQLRCQHPPTTPVEVMAEAINSHKNCSTIRSSFISGNYSRILSRLDRNITKLDVRRANTLFQLMTELDENHHSFLIVEHDSLLYEDSQEMAGRLAQHLRRTSREAKIMLLRPALDSHRQEMAELADRVGQRRSGHGRARIQPCN